MNGWTPERRARQAEAIRRWRPWEYSTGPRTAAGKARSAGNAYTGGRWRRERDFFKACRQVLREQRRTLDRLGVATDRPTAGMTATQAPSSLLSNGTAWSGRGPGAGVIDCRMRGSPGIEHLI